MVVFERFVDRNWEETSTTSAKELIAECFEKNFEEGVLWNNPIYINLMDLIVCPCNRPLLNSMLPSQNPNVELYSHVSYTHTHTLDIITCKFVVDFRTIKAEQV